VTELRQKVTSLVDFSTKEDLVDRLVSFIEDYGNDEYWRGHGDGWESGYNSGRSHYKED
jgi:hypothetical protein